MARSAAARRLPAASAAVLANALNTEEGWAEALKLLTESRHRFPGDFWINFELARLFETQSPPRIDESVRFLTVASALKPDSAGALINLGVALQTLGRSEEALAAADEALRQKEDYAEAHLGRGLALARLGREVEALASYRDAARLKAADAVFQFNLGTALAGLG